MASQALCLHFCAELAERAPYSFISLQNGSACHCSNRFASTNRTADTQCTTPCTANASQTCGGVHNVQVWKIDSIPILDVSEDVGVGAKVGSSVVDVGVAVVAVGGLLGGGYLSGAAMRVAVAAAPCVGDMPVVVHPTGLVVGGSASVGVVVVNVAVLSLVVVCGAVLLCVCRTVVPASVPKYTKGKDVQALLRMPSLPFSLFHLLYQGLALSGAGLLLQPAAPWHAVLGATVLLVCVAVPAVVARFVARGVPAKAVYATAEGRQNTALVVMIGSGEWVNTGRDCMWVQRFDSVVRAYRQPCTWYILIEFSGSFAMGVVKSVGATTAVGCGHISMAMAAVLLILFVTKAVVWPHARQRDNVIDVICLGVQMAAMVHSSAGYYRDHGAHAFWTFGVASHLLILAIALLLLKGVFDLLAEAYILHTGRRVALQEDIYAQKDAVKHGHPCLYTHATPCFPDSPADTLFTPSQATLLHTFSSMEPVGTPLLEHLILPGPPRRELANGSPASLL